MRKLIEDITPTTPKKTRASKRSKRCSICAHPDVDKIDIALMRGKFQADIAAEFNVKKHAVRAHFKNEHVSEKIIRQYEIEQAFSVNGLVANFVEVFQLTKSILRVKIMEQKDHLKTRGIAVLIKRLEHQLELHAKLLGIIREYHSTTNIGIALGIEQQSQGAPNGQQVATLADMILDAIGDEPTARLRVVDALKNHAALPAEPVPAMRKNDYNKKKTV